MQAYDIFGRNHLSRKILLLITFYSYLLLLYSILSFLRNERRGIDMPSPGFRCSWIAWETGIAPPLQDGPKSAEIDLRLEEDIFSKP
jgi:hypothetical protein